MAMAKQKQLIKQICEKLRTDSGSADALVTLTNHRADRVRIGRHLQPRKDHTPYLGVEISSSIPMNNQVTCMQKARVHFHAHARSELTAFDIADRIETLLDNESGAPQAYYDFSGSGFGEVRVADSRLKERNAPEFNGKTEVWTIIIEADLIWSTQPCAL